MGSCLLRPCTSAAGGLQAAAAACWLLPPLLPAPPSVVDATDTRCCTPQAYKYAWVVDPLDGTRQFLERTGEFTINIALLQGSRPILGVVAVPAQVRGAHVYMVQPAGKALRSWAAVPARRTGLLHTGGRGELACQQLSAGGGLLQHIW